MPPPAVVGSSPSVAGKVGFVTATVDEACCWLVSSLAPASAHFHHNYAGFIACCCKRSLPVVLYWLVIGAIAYAWLCLLIGREATDVYVMSSIAADHVARLIMDARAAAPHLHGWSVGDHDTATPLQMLLLLLRAALSCWSQSWMMLPCWWYVHAIALCAPAAASICSHLSRHKIWRDFGVFPAIYRQFFLSFFLIYPPLTLPKPNQG